MLEGKRRPKRKTEEMWIAAVTALVFGVVAIFLIMAVVGYGAR